MTAAEIIHAALIWGEEGMQQMIHACHADDPYRAEVKDQLKQLRAYRKKRFGEQIEPTEGARLVNVLEELTPTRS
jgi:hypothetical protein